MPPRAPYPAEPDDIGERHRQDLGDIRSLADSIAQVGLLNPLTVTSDGRLIAGFRRLEAVRCLGWSEVPVCVAGSVASAVLELVAERDENVCRKDMTVSERLVLGNAIVELEAPLAAERKAATHLAGKSKDGVPVVGGAQLSATEAKGEALAKAAKAAGWSRGSYRRAKYVFDTADDLRAIAEQLANDLGVVQFPQVCGF